MFVTIRGTFEESHKEADLELLNDPCDPALKNIQVGIVPVVKIDDPPPVGEYIGIPLDELISALEAFKKQRELYFKSLTRPPEPEG